MIAIGICDILWKIPTKGHSTVTELQIREIWATFLHVVDLTYGLFDNSHHGHLNNLWLYPCYDIRMKAFQLYVCGKIWGQKCAGNGVTSENWRFFTSIFQKDCMKYITPWLTFIHNFISIVLTIYEQIFWGVSPLILSAWPFLPKMVAITELHKLVTELRFCNFPEYF